MLLNVSPETSKEVAALIAKKLEIPPEFTPSFVADGMGDYVLAFSIPADKSGQTAKAHPKLEDMVKFLDYTFEVKPEIITAKDKDSAGQQSLTLKLNSEQFHIFLRSSNLGKEYYELLELEKIDYKKTEVLIEGAKGGEKPSIRIFSNFPKDDAVKDAAKFLNEYDKSIVAITGRDEVRAAHYVKFPVNPDKTLSWHIDAIKAATQKLEYPVNVDESKIHELVKNGEGTRMENAKMQASQSTESIKDHRVKIMSAIGSSIWEIDKIVRGGKGLPTNTNKVYQEIKEKIFAGFDYSAKTLREVSSKLEKALRDDSGKLPSGALEELQKIQNNLGEYLQTSSVQLPTKQASNTRGIGGVA